MWSALANLTTGIINTAVDGAQNAKNLEWQKEMFQRQQDFEKQMAKDAQAFEKSESELAFNREKEMWNMQNAYNSPKEQMKRYQDAGLSPYLIYGQGTPGNATSSPSYSPTKASKPQTLTPPQLPTFKSSLPTNLNVLEGRQILANIRNIDANTRATEENTDFNIMTKNARALQQIYKARLDSKAITYQDYLNKLKELEYNLEKQTFENQKELSNYQIKQAQEEFQSIVLSNERKKLENALYELGFEGNNPIGQLFRFVSHGMVSDFSELREILGYEEKPDNKSQTDKELEQFMKENNIDFQPKYKRQDLKPMGYKLFK